MSGDDDTYGVFLDGPAGHWNDNRPNGAKVSRASPGFRPTCGRLLRSLPTGIGLRRWPALWGWAARRDVGTSVLPRRLGILECGHGAATSLRND